jgi:glycosyltransferase involved in cell wall biosynthesis
MELDYDKRSPGPGKGLISVIIPTHARAGQVGEAIESVRRQTYENVEILVIDDASPDDTAAVLRAIPDLRLRYVRHEKRRGAAAARNTGIRMARGEWIGFLDDDDQWYADKLEKQLPLLKEFDAVLCMSIAKGRPSRVHKSRVVTPEDLRQGSFHTSGLVAKASVLRTIMFDEDLKQAQDWDLLIRIVQRYRIGWIAEPLLLYNRGEHPRITNENKLLSALELETRAVVLRKHRDFFGEAWFDYHMANALLAFISSRPGRLESVRHAVDRCGVRPVVSCLMQKVRKPLQSRIWTWRRLIAGPSVVRDRIRMSASR